MSQAPYIMPDGRTLGQFLHESQARHWRSFDLFCWVVEETRQSKKDKQSTRRFRRAEKEGGWTQKRGYRQGSSQPVAETEEEDSIARLGRDRRRRYLNERILREMAGNLTASDMEALFQPIPFGESRPSVFVDIMSPDMLPVWDLFRNIDADRQESTLQRWEEHLKACKSPQTQQRQPPQTLLSGIDALKSWSKIPKKSREALKRSSPEMVEAVEMPILEYLDQEHAEEDQLELELEDSYQRLLTHGVAMFYGLHSYTTSSGLTCLQRRKGGHIVRGSTPIGCADIVYALTENPAGGLTAKTLEAQLRRAHFGSDADSNASFIVN